MAAVARLTWRTSSFELKALTAVTAALAVTMVVFTVLLARSAPPAACFAADSGAAECEARGFYELVRFGGQIFAAMTLVPIVVGGVLGSQVFAREIERGTVQLPWSLTPRRSLWFVERAVVLLAIAAVLAVVLAVTSTTLESAIHPDVGAGATLLDFGLRGPSLVGRTIAVFAIAGTVGLLVGRTLPALLISVFAGLVVAVVVTPMVTLIQPTELIGPLGDRQVLHGIVREERYLATDGTLLTINEVTAKVPPGTSDPTTWIEENYRQAAIGIPGRRYWQLEATTAAALSVVSVLSLALGAIAARWRRPF